MRLAIDRSGRLVIPRRLREELGIVGPAQLEASVRDGRLELEVPAIEMHLEERDGVVLAVPERPLPALSAVEVRDVLEQIRR